MELNLLKLFIYVKINNVRKCFIIVLIIFYLFYNVNIVRLLIWIFVEWFLNSIRLVYILW